MYEIVKMENVEPEMYITITDGMHEVIAFSDNPQINIVDRNKLELKAFDSTNIVLSSFTECSIKVLDSVTYLQHVVGLLSDKKNGVVKVNDITIQISDYIPNDIKNGEYIEFDVARLEIW